MIVSKSFRGAFLLFLISTLLTTVGSIVDGIIVSRNLSSSAIAALAIGSAFGALIELLTGVVSTGATTQCNKEIGRGKLDRSNALFSLSCILAMILSFIFVLLVLILPGLTAQIFGSSPEAAEVHSESADYIRGLVIGLPAAFGMSLFSYVLQMENAKKRIMVAVTVAMAVNIGGDLLTVYVLRGGMFQIGLFTSVSQYMALVILLLHFRKGRSSFRFTFRGFSVRDVFRILRSGMPSLYNRLATLFQNILYNSKTYSYGGVTGVSANAIVDNMAGVLSTASKSFGSASLTVSSVLAGEEDKRALKQMLRHAILLSFLISAGLAVIIAFCANLLTKLYTSGSSAEFDPATRGIFWWSFTLIPYSLNLVMVNYYNSIQRIFLANLIMIVSNFAGPALFVVILCPFMGLNGIWLATFLGKLLVTVMIPVIAAVRNRKIMISLEDIMYLPKSFDEGIEDQIGSTTRNRDDMLDLSKDAIRFCKKHGIDEEQAYFAGLCIEEMAVIIAKQGFPDGESGFIDIRILLKTDEIIIRMRDDCEKFDPRTLQQIFNPEDRFSNIGIQMVAGMAEEIAYVNVLKLNNIIIRLKRVQDS